MRLKIVSVADGYEKTFWEYVNQDQLDYYFFILDWQQRRERTKILLAIDGKTVEGLMLIYADSVVQLRGSREAVELLLAQLSLEKVELQAPPEYEDLVFEKYRPYASSASHALVMMRLVKNHENILMTEVPVRLGVNDAVEVMRVLREADPEWWGEVTEESQRKSLESACWFGVKSDERLVAVGGARLVDFASNIHAIATDERYRNRGYATSVVSALVQEIFKYSPIALIHVLRDNAPAARAYSKVGFQPYRDYLLIKAEKIKK